MQVSGVCGREARPTASPPREGHEQVSVEMRFVRVGQLACRRLKAPQKGASGVPVVLQAEWAGRAVLGVGYVYARSSYDEGQLVRQSTSQFFARPIQF